jgi:hypothetical protein
VQGLSLSRSATNSPADDLRNATLQAFSSRSYPGDDRIALSDDRHPDYEGHRVTATLRGKDWREVTYPWLRAVYPGDPTAIPRFLRDEGFLYYLPAFLTLTLDPAAGEITDAVCYALTAPASDAAGDLKQFRARMNGLSDEERAAVAAVLRHLADRDGPGSPAQDALDSYWTPPPA